MNRSIPSWTGAVVFPVKIWGKTIPRSKETDSVYFPSSVPKVRTELVRSTGKFGIIGTETLRRRNHLNFGYGYGLQKKNGSTGTEFRQEIDGKYINVLKYSTREEMVQNKSTERVREKYGYGYGYGRQKIFQNKVRVRRRVRTYFGS